MADSSYAIALGSNRRGRHGSPARTIREALRALEEEGVCVDALSTIRLTPAMGPSHRGFANAVAIISTELGPSELLGLLKTIERAFGRRGGRRWGARILDLDIILWSSCAWEGPGLVVPHPRFRERRFVLEPLAELAPGWRDPLTGATVRQLFHRLARRAPVDPGSLGA
jgi:2-amino-4-hydroxy-6-hydroxymethyldihydropteridine diphosphokinase